MTSSRIRQNDVIGWVSALVITVLVLVLSIPGRYLAAALMVMVFAWLGGWFARGMEDGRRSQLNERR